MSLTTPSVADIAEGIVANLELALEQTIPILPKSFSRVFAKIIAAAVVIDYKYAGWIFLQIFVEHASIEETVINGKRVSPLKEWGRLIGAGDPDDATRAELSILVTVLNQVGSLPANTQLIYSPTGVVYTTVAAVQLNAPTVAVTIRAYSDQDGNGGAGAIGNLQAGDVVSFANKPPNVATDAVVNAQTVTGADGETEDEYRARVIELYQSKPQGGAYADYRVWGRTVEGILNIYPYRATVPGEVDVYVEATAASSGSADGIPTGAQLTAVAEAIELDDAGLASRRPVNAAVNVKAITRKEFDFTVLGLSAADVSAAQDTIIDALSEYLFAREPFIVGLSVFPRLDRVTQAAASGVIDDAVNSLGGSVTTVSMTIGGISQTAYTLVAGEKAKLGNVTFV